MEEVAERQNRIALEVYHLASTILAEIASRNDSIKVDEIPYRLLHIWSTVHGLVSLYISRVTLEVGNLQDAIDYILDEVLQPFS